MVIEMAIIPLAQIKISDNVLGKSESHVGQPIERKIGIKLNKKLEKNCYFIQ